MTPKEMRELADRMKNGRAYFLVVDQVAQALELGAAAMEREEWIPCSERLPEFDVPVFGIFQSSRPAGGIYERMDDGDGWLWSVANNIWLNKDGKWESDAECDDNYRVTHWRPLPIPPASDSMAQKGGAVRGDGGGEEKVE